MALIKCPECGKEISDAAKSCPNCGYKIRNKININNKKILIIPVGVIILILCVAFIISSSPASKAIKIVKSDYGKSINITEIYYNKNENGCIVHFTSGGVEDSACVHLKDKSVGYRSVFDELASYMKNSSSRDSEKQYAKKVVSYPYDVHWEYDLVTGVTTWKKIK